ncbi:MAG TPA: phycobilisome protein [Synechococcales cyanobacterium M55_K2018_004]|nr:phycobilisome protein [Synechococcales cyanobacterium M55_K2018_004]
MAILNQTLDRFMIEADGAYLNNRGLSALEQYLQTFQTRLETYTLLRDHGRVLIQQALRKLAQVQPELIQKHGSRCVYDMTEVVRYIATSILRDDEVFFKEQMMAWLDTVLLAHKQNEHCAIAYRYLQEAVQAEFPDTASSLIRPYLASIIQSLQSHA